MPALLLPPTGTAPLVARRPRSTSLVLATTLLLSFLVLVGSTRPARAATTDDERSFVNLINADRAANGQAALTPDPAAADVARAWARNMAASGQLQHNPSLSSQVTASVTASWTRIGENVGVGYGVSSLHAAFMSSPGHRANVLGDYNRVGIGVATDGTGRMWVTEVFVKGPALRSTDPFGAFDAARQVPGGLRVSGWAIDPDTSNPIEVHVYVDSWGANLGLASASRPDVEAAIPGYGGAHGYDAVIPANPGWHQVCAYGINVGAGSNRALGCKTILVGADPFGAVEAVSQLPGALRVSGWAIDPESPDPIEVHVYVDSWGANLGLAGASRPDVGEHFPGYGAAHGYDGTIGVSPGWHQVCVYGINVRSGANRALGCKSVLVAADPFGSLEAASTAPGGLRVSGWAIDPETADPIEVHVYVGSGGANLGVAAAERPDVGAFFAGYGAAHGFDATIPAVPGPHRVCAYGINVQSGAHRAIGCKDVVVPADPFGSFEEATAVPGGVKVGGWAIDPETSAPIEVHVYVDASGSNLGAAQLGRPDVGSVFWGYGEAHGYDAVIPVAAGTHRVCAYGINVGAGANRSLGCRTVLIP